MLSGLTGLQVWDAEQETKAANKAAKGGKNAAKAKRKKGGDSSDSEVEAADENPDAEPKKTKVMTLEDATKEIIKNRTCKTHHLPCRLLANGDHGDPYTTEEIAFWAMLAVSAAI